MADLKVPVSADDHSQGSPNAEITLVEYGDYQCPHCAMAHAVVKHLQRHYGDRLRFVYRNFPLVEIHPVAEPAAEVAEFAAAGNQFWPMYEALYANQKKLAPDLLAALAEQLGLDPAAARDAVEEHQFADRIEREMEGAERSGVHGTPTFFINGKRHQGAFDFDNLVAAIDQR